MIDPCSLEAKPLLPVDDALARIKASLDAVIDTEIVTLGVALGRVLADDVLSPINSPYDNNSAMDGYALSSKDIDCTQSFSLKLAGTSWAGKPYQGAMPPGHCIRIFTGAVMPDCADSVVIQEQVHAHGDSILFPEGLYAYQNVRLAGEDIQQGSILCAKQKTLTPVDLGLLASAGVSTVNVYRKLNIAFFSTGDELISLDQVPQTGKIYDSNRYVLAGMLAKPCYNAIDLGVIPDNKQQLEETILNAAKSSDVIITTGGASVGDADFIQEVLERCGEVSFWKIAIKPGKPIAYGKVGSCYFFGLPGNPVSVIVTFQQIVSYALKRLSGAAESQSLRLKVICTSTLKKAQGRQEFQRGWLSQDANGNLQVASAGQQGSNILSSMSRSNCYIILPAESKGAAMGETVTVEPFDVAINTNT